jgi:antitoxin CptB
MLNDQENARLKWSCRRGMLELDLILNSFLEKGLGSLSAQQVRSFNSLLTHTDPELYAWLMGHEVPYNIELVEIVTLIRTNS